ncbi:SLAP domain-containing protein [uncultured Lactobacillus sp.]|uniref:SLAP domain-containing protein n=1 Tax=uncultured Lactobacillus sp. TaxID=153152 RepID=UPI00261085EC|nr:SLAP domain-containing protein [uncultured Lactobacillus sp.]
MNSKKSLALGVGLCALALTAVATPVKAADTTSAQSAITQTYQPKAQDVTINYNANAGIAVWTAPNGKTTGKFVGGQTTTKVAGSQVVNGHTWYLLADNSGWIDGSYVKTEATAPAKTTTTSSTNKTTTKTPAKTESKTTYAEEIVTAGNNGAPVYSAPNASAKTKRVLAKGSNWKSFYRVENGSTWYNLGGNQFVLASDLASKNTTTKETKPADTKKDTEKSNTSKDTSKLEAVSIDKIVKVQNAKGAVVYSKPATDAKTSRVLSNDSRWKAFKQANVNGTTWYNLGGNQWVLASDVDGSNASKNTTSSTNNTDSSDIKAATGTVTVHYKPGYGIAVWSQPGKNAIAGKYLKHGTSWKYFKVANVNGTVWYNLGGNQWVSGQYLTSNNPEGIARYTIDSRFTTKITNPKGAKVYSDPNSGISTGRVLPKNSNWKVFKVLGNGDRWYNLGGNQWIMQEDTWN